MEAAGCNTLVVYLGNFGRRRRRPFWPAVPGTCHVRGCRRGDGDLINGRGDAYCGMLNCSYNLGMRHLKAYIPEYPVAPPRTSPP